MPEQRPNPPDYRRPLVLLLSIVLLVIYVWVRWSYEPTGTAKALAAATGRIGLLLAALWLAWPTLRKPAHWLPPGFAVLGILVLGILAAQPRTIFVLAPVFGALLVLASIVRAIRR